MYEVRVDIRIEAPQAEVFARLADHARFSDFPGIRSSRLLRAGSDDRNGVGAEREIRTTTGIRFVERIDEFEADRRYVYRITHCTLPIRHESGFIECTHEGSTTYVVWASRFSMPLPGAARLVGPMAKRAFMSILKATKRELERS